MGCKHSKPDHSLSIEAKPAANEYGIECSEPSDQVDREPTPHDIRQIRDELFSKDSILAIASSTTAETALSSDSLDPLHFGGNTNVRYIAYSDAKAKDPNKDYHYPVALCKEGRGVKHFVPKTDASTALQTSPSIRSSPMPETDIGGVSQLDISDRSYISGLSQLDLSDRSFRGFTQQEILVDTMSFSGRGHPSFGNLVDTMTEMDEDGPESAPGEKDILGCSYRSGPDRYYVQSRHSRHSASPFVEPTLSYKMLADMKTMALLTDVQRKTSTMMQSEAETSSVEESGKCGDTIVVCAATDAVKYHRSNSEAVPLDTKAVCSELGSGWM
jgi:hypothetical protein